MVNVARLGRAVGFPREVLDAKLTRHLFETEAALPRLLALRGIVAPRERAAVIEDINVYLLARIIDLRRRERSEMHDILALRIGRNEDVHRWPARPAATQRSRVPVEGPKIHKELQKVNHERINLGKKQNRHTQKICCVCINERLERAPPHVSHRKVKREEEEQEPPGRVPRSFAHGHCAQDDETGPAGDELRQLRKMRFAQVHHVKKDGCHEHHRRGHHLGRAPPRDRIAR